MGFHGGDAGIGLASGVITSSCGEGAGVGWALGVTASSCECWHGLGIRGDCLQLWGGLLPVAAFWGVWGVLWGLGKVGFGEGGLCVVPLVFVVLCVLFGPFLFVPWSLPGLLAFILFSCCIPLGLLAFIMSLWYLLLGSPSLLHPPGASLLGCRPLCGVLTFFVWVLSFCGGCGVLLVPGESACCGWVGYAGAQRGPRWRGGGLRLP